jgi:hypothetical protein
MTSGRDRAIVVYWSDAQGPKILIDVWSDDSLRRFREVFRALALRETREVELQDEEAVTLSNLDRFTLRLSAYEPRRSVAFEERLQQGESVASRRCIWTRSAWGWRLCWGLVDVFNASSSGHQYLGESRDGAIIEFAFRGAPHQPASP